MEQKGAPFLYSCESCQYYSNKKANYMRHLSTDKHKIKQNKAKTSNFYKCYCGKEYILSGSFSNHKKTCKFFVNKQEKSDNTELLLEKLEEQNKKIEQLEQTIKDNTNTNIINNYSNNFNLNVFLNEKCKDAININEFQESLKQAITDISNVLNISNTDGITNVLNLTYNKIDNYKKPYYSLDKSRQQLIIKDINNNWVKDKELLFDIIKPLENKYNKKQLYNFYKNLEDKNNINDKQEDEFTNIILNTTCEINKTRLIKNIINNGLNPKSI